MPFDYKKAERAIYNPKAKAEIIDVPMMNFMTIKGWVIEMAKT